ncbi:protein of unknown function [Pseudorhizobium banfieldiae]|uniref:Uncharacterized protein n=1 Tax=Pseudorhizobium banfieldiae TaxID=1125847 RepID=L0NLE8_9HYPH|nr:protein of unknown function [Pseudorhizobium banfieldiae]
MQLNGNTEWLRRALREFRMLFTRWRAGEDLAIGRAEYANRVPLIDRHEHTLVGDGIAVAVQQDEVGGAEAAPRDNDGRRVGHGGVGDLGIADDDLADRSVEPQDPGMVHEDAKNVLLLGRCWPRAAREREEGEAETKGVRAEHFLAFGWMMPRR